MEYSKLQIDLIGVERKYYNNFTAPVKPAKKLSAK